MKKRRLLSIVLSLCMVLALMPQMVFADETTTYDLWQVGEKVYYAQSGTHTDFSIAGDKELPDWNNNSTRYEFPDSGIYILQTDITMTSSKQQIYFTKSGITLDLNGKTVTQNNSMNFAIIYAENVIIQDSVGGGTINEGISIKGSLTLKSGTINSISNHKTFYADGGTILSYSENRGTITQRTGTAGTVFNGNVDLISGTISGGVFYGTVTSMGDNCTISGGVFYGKVKNATNGKISGGVYYGGIEGNGMITGTTHTVSFDLNGGSGTVPATQYFVNTYTAKALEPATDPTREGYEFAGWYTDEALTDLYDFDSKVKESITLYAGWEEIITLTVPFTTTVELDGSASPGETTFNLQVLDSSGEKLSSEDVEIEITSVKTNGAGSYDGTLTIDGTSEDIAKMLMDGVFVKQAEGKYTNWEVDDTVWGLVWKDAVVALASADSEALDNSIFIFPAEYVKTENGGYYEMVDGKEAVDKMTFINTYTKSAAGPSDSNDTNGDSDNADKTAKTGDDANLALWLALMLLSGAGITGVTAYTRRKRTNE